MRYIYKNVTQENQSVLLASKDQNSVTTKVFWPGAILELDYPGLNLYVPNTLSCIILQTPEIIPVVPVIPIVKEKPVVQEAIKTPEPEIEVKLEPKVEIEVKAAKPKPKTAKKAEKH